MSKPIVIAPGIVMLWVLTAGVSVTVDAGESGPYPAVAPPPALDTTCRSPVTATGETAPSAADDVARHAAVMRWRAAAEARYGFDFSLWWKAQGRSVTCETASGRLVCTARAAPCTVRVRGGTGVSKAF